MSPVNDSTAGSAPVGQGDYVVRQGDCISSIAVEHGLFWQTIWDDPANAELKQARGNPNVLMPGDRLTIPQIRKREESGATEQRHRFRRKGEPSRLRICFLSRGEPRSDQRYRVEIDGRRIIEGQLDGDGLLDVSIPGTARQARVTVGGPNDQEQYLFHLGWIDPSDAVSGIQQRLQNLGYGCPQDGQLGDGTRAALRTFQKNRGMAETGEVDEDTRQALSEAHRS